VTGDAVEVSAGHFYTFMLLAPARSLQLLGQSNCGSGKRMERHKVIDPLLIRPDAPPEKRRRSPLLLDTWEELWGEVNEVIGRSDQ
jgi:hypothetical protein